MFMYNKSANSVPQVFKADVSKYFVLLLKNILTELVKMPKFLLRHSNISVSADITIPVWHWQAAAKSPLAGFGKDPLIT